MKVNTELLHKIAHLCRLDFSGDREEPMRKDLEKILEWVDKLGEVDTENTEPLTHISSELNHMREDEVKEPLSHERGLKNAPKKDSDYFRVPKVINQ